MILYKFTTANENPVQLPKRKKENTPKLCERLLESLRLLLNVCFALGFSHMGFQATFIEVSNLRHSPNLFPDRAFTVEDGGRIHQRRMYEYS